MRSDKSKALKLRLKGRSYNEISRTLRVPKSTLSNWFSNLSLSLTAKKRILKRVRAKSLLGLIKRNKNQTTLAIQRMNCLRTQSKQEISQLTRAELKYVGISLYWAEGYKRPQSRQGREVTYHPVALANSDPKLICIYLKFLRDVCKVSDKNIKAEIRIYEHMSAKKLLKFWKNTTGLPAKNFGKIYYGVSKSSMGKRPFNRLPYGTISIRINNTNLFHRIMGWIDGLKLLN